MRRLVVVSAALLIAACGPDPNAVLPGMVKTTPNTGGTKPVPAGGAGGTTTTPPSSGGTSGTTSTAAGGSGGANPFAGSSGSSGGVTSSGGIKSSGGVGGGTGGKGGTSGTGTGAVGADCTNATPITTQTIELKTTDAVCFVVCASATTYGWGCSTFTETQRSVTVNGTAVACGAATLPAAKNGLYYFQIGAGGETWDSVHFSSSQDTSCGTSAGGTGASGSTGAGGSTGTGGSTGAGGSMLPADAGTNG
jgi:hypothetical protein